MMDKTGSVKISTSCAISRSSVHSLWDNADGVLRDGFILEFSFVFLVVASDTCSYQPIRHVLDSRLVQALGATVSS